MTIRQRLRLLALSLLVVAGLGVASQVCAAEALKPFILGSKSNGDLGGVLLATKEALQDQGLEVAGEYSPYPDATVLVVTDDFLKRLAVDDEGAAFLAGVRVSVTQVGNEVQVSYLNPDYWRWVYRIRQDVAPVSAKLSAALGSQEEFGAKGMSPRKLKKYHYTFGMEYFDDQMKLANYGSHQQAVKTVESNLAAGVAGTSEVYRIDIPGRSITVFGVAMSEDMSSDAAILKEVDARPLKHVAHLPYEVVVFDGSVRALHPRFRIAVSWPDLKMVGANSFFGITRSPEAIKKALTELAGGSYAAPGAGGGFNM
jgi:hypothetical protein